MWPRAINKYLPTALIITKLDTINDISANIQTIFMSLVVREQICARMVDVKQFIIDYAQYYIKLAKKVPASVYADYVATTDDCTYMLWEHWDKYILFQNSVDGAFVCVIKPHYITNLHQFVHNLVLANCRMFIHKHDWKIEYDIDVLPRSTFIASEHKQLW